MEKLLKHLTLPELKVFSIVPLLASDDDDSQHASDIDIFWQCLVYVVQVFSCQAVLCWTAQY